MFLMLILFFCFVCKGTKKSGNIQRFFPILRGEIPYFGLFGKKQTKYFAILGKSSTFAAN